jgi:hypothetical protein
MKTRVDQDRIWPTPCAQRESQKEKKEMKDDHEDGDQNSITSKFHWQLNFNCHQNDLVCPKLKWLNLILVTNQLLNLILSIKWVTELI